MKKSYMHEVVATAIIFQDDKYLIIRRSPKVKRFPGMWVVPGGHLEIEDYMHLPKDTKGYWRNVLEQALKREVKEEVGIVIDNVDYITSMATIHDDGNPSIVLSCCADYVGGRIRLQEEEIDEYRWVSLEEAKQFPLLDGIYEELIMTERKRRGFGKSQWGRFQGESLFK